MRARTDLFGEFLGSHHLHRRRTTELVRPSFVIQRPEVRSDAVGRELIRRDQSPFDA